MSVSPQIMVQAGKLLLFLAVGSFSAVSLFVGIHYFRRSNGLEAAVCFALSASLWWPLFKLGRYHARKRRSG